MTRRTLHERLGDYPTADSLNGEPRIYGTLLYVVTVCDRSCGIDKRNRRFVETAARPCFHPHAQARWCKSGHMIAVRQ